MSGTSRPGANFAHIAKFNERAVMHALRAVGPCSQTDIAHSTGLSVQAVSVIMRNLIEQGMVREVRTESVGRGRPRTILDLVPSAAHAVGIHLDPGSVTVALVDLKGDVSEAISSDEVVPDDPSRTLEVVVRLVGGVQENRRILGACMAVPGPVDPSGCITDTLWLPGWGGFRIGEWLQHRLGSRVPIVKDTIAAVIGENWVRAGQTQNAVMIFVYLGTGTGLGISMLGEPVRGYSGNAGEIGRILGEVGAAGHDAASAVANDPILLVAAAHERGVLDGGAPGLREPALVERDLGRLCEAAERGQPAAVEILERAGQRIARMVTAAVELFDANVVVFGGPYWPLLKPRYEPATLAALAEPSARGPHAVEVWSTAMGWEVGAIGAAAAVLDERFVPRAPRHRR